MGHSLKLSILFISLYLTACKTPDGLIRGHIGLQAQEHMLRLTGAAALRVTSGGPYTIPAGSFSVQFPATVQNTGQVDFPSNYTIQLFADFRYTSRSGSQVSRSSVQSTPIFNLSPTGLAVNQFAIFNSGSTVAITLPTDLIAGTFSLRLCSFVLDNLGNDVTLNIPSSPDCLDTTLTVTDSYALKVISAPALTGAPGQLVNIPMTIQNVGTLTPWQTHDLYLIGYLTYVNTSGATVSMNFGTSILGMNWWPPVVPGGTFSTFSGNDLRIPIPTDVASGSYLVDVCSHLYDDTGTRLSILDGSLCYTTSLTVP